MCGVEWTELFGYLECVCVGAIGIAEMEATECVIEETFCETC